MNARRDFGHHESFRAEQDEKPGSDRQFGLVVGSILGGIAGVRWWRHGEADWVVLLLAGIALGLIAFALLSPNMLKPLNVVWTQLGQLLARVITPVALGVIFFVAVTPVGLIMRAMGKGAISMHPPKGAQTFWLNRNPPGPSRGSIKDQF